MDVGVEESEDVSSGSSVRPSVKMAFGCGVRSARSRRRAGPPWCQRETSDEQPSKEVRMARSPGSA
jgi:hypothetical protein